MRNVSGQQGENERYWKKKRVFDTQAVDLLPDAWKLTGANNGLQGRNMFPDRNVCQIFNPPTIHLIVDNCFFGI